MQKILISGATGNIGAAILRHADMLRGAGREVYAGVRDRERARAQIPAEIPLKDFDFEKIDRYVDFLQGIDVLFLLRPPQIADIKKYFVPLVEAAKAVQVEHIVFLSVQDAEKMSMIPHHKIEKSIEASGIPYSFVRPSYFMQNLTTTLKDDFQLGRIYLPAGEGKFNLIDVDEIGEVCAEILHDVSQHRNKAYVITGPENLTFQTMTDQLNETLGLQMQYISPNPLVFLFEKSRAGSFSHALLLLFLHALPRITKKEPDIVADFERLMGRPPKRFRQYLRQNAERIRQIARIDEEKAS